MLNKMTLVLLLYPVITFQVSLAIESENNAQFQAKQNSSAFDISEAHDINRLEHTSHASVNTSPKHIAFIPNDPFEQPIHNKLQTENTYTNEPRSNPQFEHSTHELKQSRLLSASFNQKTTSQTTDSPCAFSIVIDIENSTKDSNTTEHEPNSHDVSTFDALLERNINQSNNSVVPVSRAHTPGGGHGGISNDGESRVIEIYCGGCGRIRCKPYDCKKNIGTLFNLGMIFIACIVVYVWYLYMSQDS